MTLLHLIFRSLRYHARAHVGVVLGAAIGSAVLMGALVVGDSVRESLRQMALSRLGPIGSAVQSQDRLFLSSLPSRLAKAAPGTEAVPGLILSGTASASDGIHRANQVAVIGVDPAAWPRMAGWVSSNQNQPALPEDLLNRWRNGEVVFLNATLARQLAVRPGDELIARIRKPSDLALDAAVRSSEANSLAVRLKVGAILPAPLLADFNLASQPTPPPNLFLPLNWLAEKAGVAGRANLMVFAETEGEKAESTKGAKAESGKRESEKGNETTDARGDDALARNQRGLQSVWQLEDAGLEVKLVSTNVAELSSRRVFLEPEVTAAALAGQITNAAPLPELGNGIGAFTYLANLMRVGERATPYSMVTAAGSPFTPPDMGTNEILFNDWLAADLQAKPGDAVALSYYVVDSASQLVERTNTFRVRAIVPMQGLYADRSLMPAFPGLAEAESTRDWSPAFPLRYKIRPQDESYWKAWRGTPKAFITLAAGQAMWSNRFGGLTSIRFLAHAQVSGEAWRRQVESALRSRLYISALGLRIEPVRAHALRAAAQGQDFGQLFLGFSFFLVGAALLLMALLFRFSLEQRAAEIGTLLALGFTVRQVRRLLLLEGIGLALLGGILGSFAGLAYAQAMLWGLRTLWSAAIAGAALQFHVTSATLLLGFGASAAVAALVLRLTLRRLARQPIQNLLTGQTMIRETDRTQRTYRTDKSYSVHTAPVSAQPMECGGLPPLSSRPPHSPAAAPSPTPRSALRTPHWIALFSFAAALALVLWASLAGGRANVGAFFGAGSLLLLAGLAAAAAWLGNLAGRTHSENLTLSSLALRGCARRRGRSLATVALLACGSFLIAAIGAFRLDANSGAARPESGTGGFAWIGESAVPVVQDLNTPSGRDFFGLESAELAGARVTPLRVREGDEASCLNLSQAQRPRLLGVKPERLRGRFTFTEARPGARRQDGWALLAAADDDAIPAVADANSIEWALGKKLGDTLDYTDELGRPFKVRLAGAVANSILQGSLVIDEAQFLKRFPSASGCQLFLIDAASNSAPRAAAALGRALQDTGLQLTPAAQRLNDFNAVQNTYLGTFQALGGLGLLLGSAGLGIVVLRNVLERRGELALLAAVGFRKRALRRLVLREHLALLGLGLGLGVAAALVAVLPALLTPGSALPCGSLALTLGAVLLNGVLFAWLATVHALRGELLAALRNE